MEGPVSYKRGTSVIGRSTSHLARDLCWRSPLSRHLTGDMSGENNPLRMEITRLGRFGVYSGCLVGFLDAHIGGPQDDDLAGVPRS